MRQLSAVVLFVLLGCSSAPGGSPQGGASSSGSSSGAACLGNGADCTSTPNDCCSGVCSANTSDPSQPDRCAKACTSGSSCNSGCCAKLSNANVSVCAPRGFCQNTCVAAGSSCMLDEDCCLGSGFPSKCVTANGGASATCANECSRNVDCVSGCCAPLTNANASVCSARQFCP